MGKLVKDIINNKMVEMDHFYVECYYSESAIKGMNPLCYFLIGKTYDSNETAIVEILPEKSKKRDLIELCKKANDYNAEFRKEFDKKISETSVEIEAELE